MCISLTIFFGKLQKVFKIDLSSYFVGLIFFNFQIDDTQIKATRKNKTHFEYNDKVIKILDDNICITPLFQPFQSVVMIIENENIVLVSVWLELFNQNIF